MDLIKLIIRTISVFKKRVARTCAIIRVWDYPNNQNLEQFIQKVRKYAELTELTPYAAHELIKAIYVGAPDKSSGKRRQSIHISYDLIGFIPLSELMTQEMA